MMAILGVTAWNRRQLGTTLSIQADKAAAPTALLHVRALGTLATTASNCI